MKKDKTYCQNCKINTNTIIENDADYCKSCGQLK